MSGPNRRAVLGAGVGLAAIMTGCVARDQLRIERLSFSDLDGWATADHAAALSVFASTKPIARSHPALGVEAADWASIRTAGPAREAFEASLPAGGGLYAQDFYAPWPLDAAGG